jgi:transcriptional regulator with XRE-family HTH domain
MEGLHRRIRALRKERGWSGCQFAKLAGITPAYLSLIEHGHRVPAVEVAARFATLLGDDSDRYREWAAFHRIPEDLRPRGYGDSGPTSRGEDLERRVKRPPGRPAGEPLAFDGEQTAVDPSQLIAVPVLMPGPISNPPAAEQSMGRFYLDPQLLSRRCSPHLIAVRLDPSNTIFVAGLMRPDDLVVIDRELPKQLGERLIYAWITAEGLLLARSIFTATGAILTPVGDERVSPHTIAYRSESELHALLLGVVIWSARSWVT